MAASQASPPPWLDQLLAPSSLPTFPYPAPHDKATHPSLTALIADAGYHPALEAALHLANNDLYSAHFLVRKGQGGAKELDWGHAILHRLEGDMGNAKCWYTDLSNLAVSEPYCSFWAPQGDRSDQGAKPQVTPGQFLDLLLLYLPSPSSYPLKLPRSKCSDVHERAQAIRATSEFSKKIQDAYDLEQLEAFVTYLDHAGKGSAESGGQKEGPDPPDSSTTTTSTAPPLSREEVEDLARAEIRHMVLACGESYGWGNYGSMQGSVEAFREQSGKSAQGEDQGQRVEHNAQGMVLGGGNRKF